MIADVYYYFMGLDGMGVKLGIDYSSRLDNFSLFSQIILYYIFY